MAAPPEHDTKAYRWWEQGARDEVDARTEGLTAKQLELIGVLDSLAKLRTSQHAPDSNEDLVTDLARIYCPDRLRRKYRL